jgi:hypothetical protein
MNHMAKAKLERDLRTEKKVLARPHIDVSVEARKITTAGEAVTVDKVFQLYALFAGDCVRVGHATGLETAEVERMAIAGKWDNKLKAVLRLQKSGRPGDMERGINRAVNFIQAHRLRQFLDRMINMIARMDEDKLEDFCLAEEITKDGAMSKKITTRPFADLASALEKCHAMTYQALSDTASDRKARGEEPDEDLSVSELHAAMANAIAQHKTGDEHASAFAVTDTPNENQTVVPFDAGVVAGG